MLYTGKDACAVDQFYLQYVQVPHTNPETAAKCVDKKTKNRQESGNGQTVLEGQDSKY